MGKVATGLSMSLDGFIAGPNDDPEQPLGDGGKRLLAWYFRTPSRPRNLGRGIPKGGLVGMVDGEVERHDPP